MDISHHILNPGLTFLAGLSGLERWQGVKWSGGSLETADLWMRVLIVGLLVILVGSLTFLIVRRRLRRGRARRDFLDQCRRRGLSPEEQSLLTLLAKLARLNRHDMIFVVEASFEQGMSALLRSEKVGKMSDRGRTCMLGLLSSLRNKLGFLHSPDAENDVISGSGQVLEGSAVNIGHLGMAHPGKGVVRENNALELVVESSDPLDVVAGQTCLVHYCDGGSTWEIEMTVLHQKDRKITLKHSDLVRFVNRRAFPRIPVRRQARIAEFPFEVSAGLGDFQPQFRPCQVIELAGAGLKIESLTEVVQGQRVLIVLQLSDGKVVQSLAKIQRCGSLGQGLWLLGAEMIGLGTSSIAQMARETNIAELENRKRQSAAAEASSRTPMRDHKETVNA